MDKLSTQIGNVAIGKNAHIIIQSMTNTDTADVDATVKQILELAESGSELVRITVDSHESSIAVPKIISEVRKKSTVPIIWDFHFNGHIFLQKYPKMAQSLDKYRINPWNVGVKGRQDSNFDIILWVAKKHNKPIRIGVNWGSIDNNILEKEMSVLSNQWKTSDEIIIMAMVKSAIESADYAKKFWIAQEHIIVSVKHSNVLMMIEAYRKLSKKCNYLLHIWLTEAGWWITWIISSSIALWTLLQEWIGDTIRVSIPPEPGQGRSLEVEVCKYLLQSMKFRYFSVFLTLILLFKGADVLPQEIQNQQY